MANLPVWAPFTPPLTGASKTDAPCFSKFLDNSLIRVGELVLRSIQIDPDDTPSINPSSPIDTALTSGGPGREVKMRSADSASCFGVSAHSAPNSRRSVAASLLMSWTTMS